MAYISDRNKDVGSVVRLTKVKSSMAGYFEVGSIVKITEVDSIRGYTFMDEFGNEVAEAGFDGFEVLRK